VTELAAQVTSVARSVTRHMPLRVICVTGGASAKTQKRMLDEGVDVVIGTPGRVQYLIDEGMVRHPCLESSIQDGLSYKPVGHAGL
jgi:superfamily II DNA/RNA helicase